jgi:hypothetical protein
VKAQQGSRESSNRAVVQELPEEMRLAGQFLPVMAMSINA